LRGTRSLAAEKLLSRTWGGLTPRDVEKEEDREDGAVVEIGRDGVAREYHFGQEDGVS